MIECCCEANCKTFPSMEYAFTFLCLCCFVFKYASTWSEFLLIQGSRLVFKLIPQKKIPNTWWWVRIRFGSRKTKSPGQRTSQKSYRQPHFGCLHHVPVSEGWDRSHMFHVPGPPVYPVFVLTWGSMKVEKFVARSFLPWDPLHDQTIEEADDICLILMEKAMSNRFIPF